MGPILQTLTRGRASFVLLCNRPNGKPTNLYDDDSITIRRTALRRHPAASCVLVALPAGTARRRPPRARRLSTVVIRVTRQSLVNRLYPCTVVLVEGRPAVRSAHGGVLRERKNRLRLSSSIEVRASSVGSQSHPSLWSENQLRLYNWKLPRAHGTRQQPGASTPRTSARATRLQTSDRGI